MFFYSLLSVAKQIASLPFTPGHECVGTIAKLGPGTNLKEQKNHHHHRRENKDLINFSFFFFFSFFVLGRC